MLEKTRSTLNYVGIKASTSTHLNPSLVYFGLLEKGHNKPFLPTLHTLNRFLPDVDKRTFKNCVSRSLFNKHWFLSAYGKGQTRHFIHRWNKGMTFSYDAMVAVSEHNCTQMSYLPSTVLLNWQHFLYKINTLRQRSIRKSTPSSFINALNIEA